MSDMKCPYCNKTLHCGATLKSDEYLIDLYQCANPECESTEFLVGCKEFWDILGQYRRTRKALETGNKDLSDKIGKLETELERTRKALDKGMEHITGLNNMIESWLNLINSDLDQETKLRILKSAISAYVENKGDNNEK